MAAYQRPITITLEVDGVLIRGSYQEVPIINPDGSYTITLKVDWVDETTIKDTGVIVGGCYQINSIDWKLTPYQSTV